MRVGVIGCGTISEVYLRNLAASPEVEVVACADLVPERAAARAAEFGIGRATTQSELLGDPAIDLVVNLTVPAAHFEVSMAALQMGKHLWSEKPLGLDREQSAALTAEADRRGLLLGCAPDTILGAGLQTCRRLVDDGLIGEPLAGIAVFMNRGPERWHPDPVFLYQPGAGPLWDVGIYHVAAMVSLLGPVSRVTAIGRKLYPERVIGTGPRAGQPFSVGTDTYVTGILQFASGALVNVIAAFGVWGGDLPKVQLYGTDGVLNAPDPNTFGGPVTANLYAGEAGWRDVPLLYDHTDACVNCRGIGVVDMVRAAAEGRPPRASGTMAHHVLDVMQSFADSSATGRHVDVASTCERPAPLPIGVALTRRDG
jgi:predicted dehydrogenase